MHEWEIWKSQDTSPKAEKLVQTQLTSIGIQNWQHFVRMDPFHHTWTFSWVFYSNLQSNLQGRTEKNLNSQKLPALKWQVCEMTVLSECLTRFNSLTCELQHCRHWKKKHKCLCHKHGILHLDIQEGILQWILDWLSSPPWHHNQSGVHLWVQNLGKVRLNAFMAEWSCHETVSNWVTGVPPPKPSYQWVWDSRHPCLLHLQHNTEWPPYQGTWQ